MSEHDDHVVGRLAGEVAALNAAMVELARQVAATTGGRSWAMDFDLRGAWPNPVTWQRPRPEPDLAVAIWNQYAVDVDVALEGGEAVAHVSAGKLVVQNMPVAGLVFTASAQPAAGATKLRVVRYERPQTVGIWAI